ncbi:MAG: lysophospholipid acyltransferase family protein [Sphingomonas sp.]
MDRLRTILFSLFFFGLSGPMVLLAPLAALFGRAPSRAYANAWAGLLRWSAGAILGIETRVEGTIPPGPLLFAAKHESIFEAIELTRMLHAPASVMKRELARIPIWGWCARRYGVIVVDRAASAIALRAMMRDARTALDEGRSILIFPEGTRVAPGEAPPLRSGFAGLYRVLGIPVVPVAVRSGHVWPRKGPKHPGVVTLAFGEPIPSGLPRAEIEARVHAAINRLND